MLVAAGMAVAGVAPAMAHPHILATVRAEILWSEDGKVTALRQSWIYDPAYSAFATRNYKKGGGDFSQADLAGLAKTQIEALAEYGYFTAIVAGQQKVELAAPEDYGFRWEPDGVLVLSFTLPMKTAVALPQGFTVEIFDPNFFAYFTMPEADDAVRLDRAPKSCAASVSGPNSIDLKQPRSIPATFWAALDGSATAGRQFVNRIVVSCR